MQLYTLAQAARAYDPEQVTFTWNGTRYARTGGGLRNVSAFSVHPFEGGDFIVADRAGAAACACTEYALLHQLDRRRLSRSSSSTKTMPTKRPASPIAPKRETIACRVDTREQLFAFARATAARKKNDGGLAIRLADEPQKRRR